MQVFTIFLVLLFTTYLVILLSLFARRWWKRGAAGETEEIEAGPAHATTGATLEVINVWKAFDAPVLRGITLAVPYGETLGVLGKSGTGKSVLLKLIAGFLRPDSGLILFEGRDITDLPEARLLEHRKRVSYVFQGGAFFDFLDVRGNIAYPLRERGITDETAIRERVDYLLDAVELEGMGNLRYDSLSEGAKKQVAIARAMAINPQVILYDEPTTGVDPIIGKSLSRLIRKLSARERLTSIVVTHDLKCLEIVADQIVLLKDGLIHFRGTAADFAASADPFVEAFRTGKRFVEPLDQALSG
jgi:phospholipid/cholesterol/gamma-HCH transport system ATP-binding protein